MPRRYPLALLARLRREQVLSSAAMRKEQEAQTARARGDAARAEQTTQAHVEAITRTDAEQTERLEQGALRAADLLQHGAWTHVAARTTEALKSAEAIRRREQVSSEEALHAATEQLAASASAAQVVTKHQERWAQAEHTRVEEAQAEEAEDRWRPR